VITLAEYPYKKFFLNLDNAIKSGFVKKTNGKIELVKREKGKVTIISDKKSNEILELKFKD